MIEINLLPGAKRGPKKQGPSVDYAALLAGIRGRIKDPYLLVVVGLSVAALGSVGWLFRGQQQRTERLTDAEARAKADSARYALVVAQLERSKAKRDSVVRQFKVIRTIDGYRFVWAHLLDEIGRTLPPYTWLAEVRQTTSFSTAGAAAAPDPKAKKAGADTVLPPMPPLGFRLRGFTADYQALTRYMRDLESSPFIYDVRLLSSENQTVENRSVTRFEFEASYEAPVASAIVTAPLSVRVK